ncbi:hypothetical protein LTR53_016124 [Teratosphaeriaceae sp. CCFEE 6253]|nr:hypothetical protein LTR53_016124 [Teratosphaeriaceae sp. CCFEE 6253]
MAVVVEQTIPFPSSSLDLQNSQRWNNLLPLIRPSVKSVRTAKGRNILVDQALIKSKSVYVAAAGTLGAFSSKLLDDRSVTAIITEYTGAESLSVQEIWNALQSEGAAKHQGLVLVRKSSRRHVEVQGTNTVEVEVPSEFELDHILHLLSHATDACKSSTKEIAELLKGFIRNASTAHSKFHIEKVDGSPALMHADGAAGYEKAKHAVERNLKHAMEAHASRGGDVTYSVHYSDVNGLSRLENYIIAGSIAQYLDSASIPYRLSHSTILDHSDAARGFSVSICPVPAHHLKAQARPQQHETSPGQDDTGLRKTLSGAKAQIPFEDAAIRKRIQSGCDAVIKAEPAITDYDTIVGDGDCGYTLRDGAKQVLSFIEGKDLAQLPERVAQLVSELEINMGGTSGALYCIYLTALASALAAESSIPKALQAALQQLMKYTRARLGDRTMMDSLIPYVDTLEATDDVKQAVEKAREGVEGTKRMQAQLGRSAYLDDSATQGVPDPGAYGLFILLQGMSA